jgi:uncharacterized protein YhdP
MTYPLAGKVFRQLCTLILLILVMSAIYVVAGRLLLPLASDYSAEVEQRLSQMTGMQASLSGLEGELQGFNPVLRARSLTLTPHDATDEGASLAVDDVELVLDVGRSLWERRLILSRAQLRSPVIELHEQEAGGWQFAGFTGTGGMTLDDGFNLATSLGSVELSGAQVIFNFAGGDTRTLSDADVQFQSRRHQHRLMARAVDVDTSASVTVYADLIGGTLSALDGNMHVDFSLQDWAHFVAPVLASHLDVQVLEMEAGLQARFDGGRLVNADGHLHMPSLRVQATGEDTGPTVTLTDIGANVTVREQDGDWQVWLTDLGVTRGGTTWSDSEIYAAVMADGLLELRASRLDAGIVSGVLRDLALLPPAGVEELVVLNPEARLKIC